MWEKKDALALSFKHESNCTHTEALEEEEEEDRDEDEGAWAGWPHRSSCPIWGRPQAHTRSEGLWPAVVPRSSKVPSRAERSKVSLSVV